MNTMKNILLVTAFLIAAATKAQVTKVYIQASGLTCSMCSNAIYKALKTIDFVDRVDANVKHYTFEVTFKANTEVDFNKIKNKVEDAGFSVSGFSASIYFNNTLVKENQEIKIGNARLLFVNGKDQTLNGEIKVRFVDRGFVPAKESRNSRHSSPTATEAGIYHVTI